MAPIVGQVEHVHVVRRKRGAPEAVARAEVRVGRGLTGDHHDRPGVKRAVTLVAAETLAFLSERLGFPIAPGASRRNVTVRGIALDTLGKGTQLEVGDALLVVTGPCDPCERMETALGAGALALMEGKGGLVARVVRGGSFGPGDAARVVVADGVVADGVGAGAVNPSSGLRPPPPPVGGGVETDQQSRKDAGAPRPSKRAPQTAGPHASPGRGRRSGAEEGSTAPPPDTAISPTEQKRRAALQKALLAWFRASQRDLPWRRTRDPYAIWVSEVMLQQTQVSTVIGHWTRFLETFPTVEALGRAPQEAVLARWSGLGYYARARNMHRAAQAMVERHEAKLPGTLDELRALPGFGPYTAGAIASLAFGLDAPLVDGNVARVFCRLEGWESTVEEATKQAWTIAPELLARGEARDWNQALMELGATVCTPARPSCDACPVRSHCRGLARGEPTTYPLPKKKPVKKLLRLAVLARREGDAVVVVKRDESGLFGGLWELPSTELAATDDAAEIARDAARALCGRTARIERVGQVSQVLTHRLVEAEVFAVTGGRLVLPEGGRVVQPEALAELGIASLTEKLLRAARVPVPDGHGRRRKEPPAAQGRLFG